MDQTTHEVRSTQWKDIILRCQNRPAEMSAKQWMEENQINEKSYYYWQRKIRKIAFAQMDYSTELPAVQQGNAQVSFAEIRVPDNQVSDNIAETFQPSVVIKTPSLTVALSNTISDSLLTRILHEVSHA